MASTTVLHDIDDKFLQCSICLDQLKEPKLLPCIHRYCRDCLGALICLKQQQGFIDCPDCIEQHIVPSDGVDGFKTDFNIQNITEFIKLQESLKDEPVQVCIGCTKRQVVTTYCFKCNDFLCDGCHDYHMTNMMFKDHRPHIIALSDVESRNLSMEKLASLKEVPKCHVHSEKLSELCCKTCNNMPICMACGTFGRHRGHDLHEVSSLAEMERKSLSSKLSTLEKYKDKVYHMKEKIAQSKENLESRIVKHGVQLQRDYEEGKTKTLREISGTDEEFETQSSLLREVVKIKFLERNHNQSWQTYQEIRDAERRYTDKALQDLKRDHEIQKKKLSNKLEVLNKAFEQLSTGLQTQRKEQYENMEALSDHLDNIIKRYENVTSTAASILATRHDWTDALCIPDICVAVDHLAVEMGKEFPKLESLSDIKLERLSTVTDDNSAVCDAESFQQIESAIDVAGLNYNGWNINSISSSPINSLIAVTGEASAYKSHITVIDITGRIHRQDIFKSQSYCAWRYCCFLSQHKVATVGDPDEIGIYDIRDADGRSYTKKNIRDVIVNCPANRRVTCVATDPVNNHIIVGTNTRYMYAFDDQLNYSHTMTLPDEIEEPTDIAYTQGGLLICDVNGKKAYAITSHGHGHCTLLYEFDRPDLEGGNWSHRSLCTDKRGFVYILWSAKIRGFWKRLLVQYNQGNGHVQKTGLIDGDQSCIATADTVNGEKLLVASYSAGRFLVYGLVRIRGEFST